MELEYSLHRGRVLLLPTPPRGGGGGPPGSSQPCLSEQLVQAAVPAFVQTAVPTAVPGSEIGVRKRGDQIA